MTKLIGNALIFFVCALIQLNIETISQKSVVVMLIAAIIGILSIDIKSSKLNKICACLYLLACLIFPELVAYIPVILWHLNSREDYGIIILSIFNIINLINHNNLELLVSILILSMLTIFINYLIKINSSLNDKLKTLRDTSKEHELLIEEKNRNLIKSQDSEIYAATLKERNRIAREIHDNVGHMLTRSILQIGAIKTINKDTTLTESLDNLHDTLNTAMTNIRESVHDLHDDSIDLKNAINDIIQSIDNMQITFDYDISQNVPRNIKYCFIGIVKEAISNTIKHSNAYKITIILREHPAFYQLLIEDNGDNINLQSHNGIGLSNIKDRVNSLNGTLKITTENGFKILISIFKERIL